MTLREFFDYLGAHPFVVIGYFMFLPLLALMIGLFGRGEGHQSPWKHLYMVLVYGVCIPGIFSVALSVYQFMFERGSIMNANLFTQILPIVSMGFTLGIIRRNVNFDAIPGFDRISSLVLMIGSVFILMYLLDRTHIFAFVYMKVEYLLLIVLALLLVFRYGLKQLYN